VDDGARYQLLDHATDNSPLWDTRRGIKEHRADGTQVELHRDRSPEELRPELERLLRDGHVELCVATDPQFLTLSLDEALAVIRDERNWYTPIDLGEPEGREVIYELSLTESGGEEFRMEQNRRAPS
jgi:hypothetical protein